MPPVTTKKELPEGLVPYGFYKLHLSHRGSDKEAKADCPFCGHEQRFTINVSTGQWRCLRCNSGSENGKSVKGGNALSFIKSLHELGISQTKDFSDLRDRGVSSETLQAWEVCKSPISGEWLVPGYNIEGKLCQLYRYAKMGSKRRLIAGPKPAFNLQLFGINLWDKSKEIVYVCEGPWDAMILYELLRQTKQTEGGLAPTGVIKSSLYDEVNIIAVPGCNIFFERWLPLLSGKRVVLLFDNDHPKKNEVTGQMIPPAAFEGVKRISEILSASPSPPVTISYLAWGPDGFDPSLPSGTDLRDLFKTAGNTLGKRIEALDGILGRITLSPTDWLKEVPEGLKTAPNETAIQCIPCDSYKTLINAWKKALKWTEGLDCALTVMLASISSVRLVGDQLWVKVLGPASCGKSTLCEALSINSKYVLAKSTVRGFHSGYGDGEDCSLISQLRDKTLITKDGDTLLQSPNLGQILSEGRDLYDTVSRTSYRNKASRDYIGVRMTWLLCGTSSLRSIDSSELGERFLDCVIMEGIDDELEDEILTRVANRVARNMSLEATQEISTQYEPEMANAMGLTGGYVNHLRQNITGLMGSLEVSSEALHYCTRLGKFVAFMRARPSSRQDETAEREFAARLVSQHIRLAMCLACVMNKKSVDSEVLARTRKVALDTARGKTIEIARHLFHSEDGLEPRSIALYTSMRESDVRNLLRFLKKIEVVEVFLKRPAKGITGKPTWVLTERMKKLWRQVYEIQEIEE